jgi:putative acetyltransferase
MVTYRLANAGDTADIVSLLTEIMQHHGVAIPEESRLESVVRSALGSPHHSFVLAEDAGAAVGMCALVFTYSTWSAALACELQDVVVREERRGVKIGRGLIIAAEAVARERQCAQLHLMAEAWNLEAHAFYRSLGLTEKTCLYYERDLGPA